MKTEKDEFEDFLQEWMQEGGLEEAPTGFTQRVMAEIAITQAAQRSRWKPVITRKGWMGIAAAVAIATLVGMGLPWSSSPTPAHVAAEKALDASMGWMGSLRFPSLLLICVATVFLLFALERWLSRKSRA